jgi:hypothetical protein
LPESAPFLLKKIVVFHTAKSVRLVSPVVAVVISFVAGPPRVKLQPPKEYPALDVVVLRARDSVESLSDPSETLVAVSEAGVELPSVLLSKTIVGFVAVVALADGGTDTSPAIVRIPVRTIAVVLFDSDMILVLATLAMIFPSAVRCVLPQ